MNLEQITTPVIQFFDNILFGVELWRLVLATVIIILSLALRKIFVKIVMGFLKSLAKKTAHDWDDKLVDAIDPPARIIIVTLGFYFAANILKLPTESQTFISHTFRSLLIFSLLWSIYRASEIIAGILEKLAKKTETYLDDILVPFVDKGVKVVIFVIGISVIAKEWNYDIATLLAGLGLGGLAFALAAQDALSNLFGGITIMIDKPFSIGDWIKTSEIEGVVEQMGFRSTRVRTFSQALVTVPNSKLINSSIINWSKMGKRRIKFNLGVTYSTSSSQLKLCLDKIRELLKNHKDVHPQTIMVYFENFGNSSLEIFVYFFTKTTNWEQYLAIREDINLKIMGILEELGVEVAFPSKSVNIKKNEKALESDIHELN